MRRSTKGNATPKKQPIAKPIVDEPERHIDVPDQDTRLGVVDDALEHLEWIGDIDRPGAVGAEFPGGEQQDRERDAAGDDGIAAPIDRRGFGEFERAFVQRHCTCALMR